MGWKTKWPEIGLEPGFTSCTDVRKNEPKLPGCRPGDRDVADELFGRRGGQAEDEVVDVRRKALPPASILSMPTSTSAEIAPAGAVKVSLSWIQVPRVASSVRRPLALDEGPGRPGRGSRSMTVSAQPVDDSPSVNRTSGDSVYSSPGRRPERTGQESRRHSAGGVRAGQQRRPGDGEPAASSEDQAEVPLGLGRGGRPPGRANVPPGPGSVPVPPRPRGRAEPRDRRCEDP